MKKIRKLKARMNFSDLEGLALKKKFRMVRFTVFSFFLSLIQVMAVDSYSQMTKLSLNASNEALEVVLKTIEDESEFFFLYNKDLIDVEQKVNINVENETVKLILDNLFDGKDISYVVYDRQIILSNKDVISEMVEQQKTITGKVIDKDGNPLPGVTIVVKGSSIGTITDMEGNYTIKVSESATIVFSFIGLQSQEFTVENQTVIDVVLLMDTTSVDEIIVVGYGTQKQVKITGAVEQVKAIQFKDIPVSTVAQKFAGQSAGMVISTPNGKPGSDSKIRIRGLGSLGAGDSPLIIVDGFPVGNQIPNALNPDDIESVSVLKDASSTAIYGARGANGVILITTKSAVTGTSKFEYNTYFGVQNVPESRRLDVLNGTEYASFMKETLEEQGGIVPEIYQNPEQYGEGTNWIDELLVKNALTQNHNLTYSGGNDIVKGVISGGYLSQEGILPNTNFERYSLRANINGKISDHITTGLNLFASRTHDAVAPTNGSQWNDNGGTVMQAYLVSPLQSPYDEKGDLVPFITEESPRYIPMPNPIYALKERDRHITNSSLNSTGFVEVDFLKNFSYKLSFGVGYASAIYEDFRSSTIGTGWNAPPQIATAEYRTSENISWNIDNLLNYSNNFGDHSVKVMAGYTAQKYDMRNSWLAGRGFPNDDIHTVTNAETITSRGNGGTQWSMAAYFTRLNYDFKGKYLVQATFRQEGSSRFGKNNKWGTFPSASVGWRVSEEEFFPDNKVLTELKIRGSYGLTGNNNIGNYTQLASMVASNYVFNNYFAEGQRTSSFSNSELGWEISKQFDLGMDLAFYENRIVVGLDYYTKHTTDMLFNVPIPAVSGYQSAWDNTGEIKNQGVEFTLYSRNLVGEFKWNTNFNVSYNKHEVTDLNGLEQLPPSKYHITTLGGQVGEFYGYKAIGFYNSQEDLDTYPGWGGNATGLGAIIFEDVNEDGVISMLDKTVIGDPHPDFVFGITNSFSYKNFDFSFLMTGATGYQIFKITNRTYFNLVQRWNARSDVLDRWRSPEDQGAGLVPTSTINARSREWSDKWLENGNHLWVKNITLGYSLPQSVISKIGVLSSFRAYVSIQNALLFSHISESNPEVSWGNGGTDGNSRTLGVDESSYPVPRIVTMGFNITF